MAEHPKHPHGDRMEAGGSCHEMILREFDRNGIAENTSKDGPGSRVKACEVEKISRRLNILEEDTRAMKKALFESLEECRNLLNEINQELNKSHQLCNEAANVFMAPLEDHHEAIHPPKGWRPGGVGLSEIFEYQPNLSLVFKHFKANLLALTDSTKSFDLVHKEPQL